MTYDIRGELLLNMANWQKGLEKASRQTAVFGKSMKTVANGIKAAWTGIAIVSIKQAGDAIADVTKMYQEDVQSQKILSAVIANNVKGHQAQKATVEENISAWQTLSNVQDDKIRPAYAYLIRATKSITKSNKLMKISLDLAAGANIDLKAAASAVGRAYTGNLMALNKLAPGIKKLKDPLAEVERRFKGLAKLQASEDPFTAMNIVMDEFKEKLGKSFLPIMKSFVSYMQKPEFQKALDNIAFKVQKFGEWFASPEGQEAFKGWMTDLKNMITLAGDFLGLVSDVKKLLTPAKPKTRKGLVGSDPSGTLFHPMTGADLAARLSGDTRPSSEINAPKPVNLYINVEPITGKAVVKLLKGEAGSRGVPVGRMLL